MRLHLILKTSQSHVNVMRIDEIVRIVANSGE